MTVTLKFKFSCMIQKLGLYEANIGSLTLRSVANIFKFQLH
jgi:hypothetical protein